MKTKKFLMTSLLVMGMIIAKAANGYPPELVLVSQPVLTYNTNSVTIYYDVQNIGDFTYRGDLCIFLDPDNGHCFANKYMKVSPGAIKRISVSIPSYRINPSWVYTVMPYYELDDDLYSFTVFEYFEPVRFCWTGYRNEPWVVIHIGPRIRYYERPSHYRFYYDGYRPMLPPPPPGHGPGPAHPHAMPPMDPHHHTYGYHHSNGGYPANFKPEHEIPGYNRPSEAPASAPTARPTYSDTPGSTSSRTPVTAPSSATTRPSTSTSSSSSATTRPSSSTSTRPSATSAPSSSSRPTSTSSSSSSSRTGTTTRSSTSTSSSATTRPSATPSSSTSSRSATSTSSSSSSSSRSATTSSASSSRSSSSSSRSGTTTSRR